MLPGGASTFSRPNLRGPCPEPVLRLSTANEAMKTSHVRANDTEERWYLYDASEHILGHMASEIAMRLMGKDRPEYTPSELGGAHVVVVNAGKVRMTGNKLETKEYQKYSGYPGGLYRHSLDRLRERRPQDIIKLAVRRMLPKTRLGKSMLSRLKVYGTDEHPHTAQQPSKVEALLR
jgi:large subunit ribosomal protein L13